MEKKSSMKIEHYNYDCLPPSTSTHPTRRPPPPSHTTDPQPHAPPHTSRMHHTVIWKDTNRTPTKPLMANRTMPILIDNDTPVQPPRHAPTVHVPLTLWAEQHGRFHSDLFYAAELRDYPLFVQERVCISYAPEEVGFEVFDGQSWGDQIQSSCCRQSCAMFREEVESWGPVWLVRRWGLQVEGEQDVVDG